MEYVRTVHIWDIEQLLIYYNNHRLIFADVGINKQVIEDIFANRSIGSILMRNYLDEDDDNTYFKIISKGEEVSSIINYYRRNKNNWSVEEKRDFFLFQFPVELIYKY